MGRALKLVDLSDASNEAAARAAPECPRGTCSEPHESRMHQDWFFVTPPATVVTLDKVHKAHCKSLSGLVISHMQSLSFDNCVLSAPEHLTTRPAHRVAAVGEACAQKV